MEPVDLNIIDKCSYLPDYLEINYSSIPGAGLGIFAKKDLSGGKFLGNYVGIMKERTPSEIPFREQLYTFDTTKCNKIYTINGYDLNTSNWTRFMNCALNSTQENVKLIRCTNKDTYLIKNKKLNLDGYIMYYTKRDIKKGEELMYNYGDKYVSYLLSLNNKF